MKHSLTCILALAILTISSCAITQTPWLEHYESHWIEELDHTHHYEHIVNNDIYIVISTLHTTSLMRFIRCRLFVLR